MLSSAPLAASLRRSGFSQSSTRPLGTAVHVTSIRCAHQRGVERDGQPPATALPPTATRRLLPRATAFAFARASACGVGALPSQMRGTFISRSPAPCHADLSHLALSFRQGTIRATDTRGSEHFAHASVLASQCIAGASAPSGAGGITSPYQESLARQRLRHELLRRINGKLQNKRNPPVALQSRRQHRLTQEDRVNSELVWSNAQLLTVPQRVSTRVDDDDDEKEVASGVTRSTCTPRDGSASELGGDQIPASYGDGPQEELSARWGRKFYGRVTFGPRNFPYPSSRWLARRFRMKKHKIVKRFRFRRYKLAAVANLPFAKMIRVGMLPELKSSKSKKGDEVEAGLSAQLVSAVSNSGGKTKGRRARPKSKYQV